MILIRKMGRDNFISVIAAFFLSLLIVVLLGGIFVLGYFTHRDRIFPYNLLVDAGQIFKFRRCSLSIEHCQYIHINNLSADTVENTKREGTNLVVSIGPDKALKAEIVDMELAVLHRWNLDWFRVWPNPEHLTFDETPKSVPGTNIHGIILLRNGDIVFNYEGLGMVRMDFCGEIVWKLPYSTHHSVHEDEDGNIWASGRIRHDKPLEKYPNIKPPFDEPTVLKVSPEGRILEAFSVFDLLFENGYKGLLSLSTIRNRKAVVTGDILHLNDVETFPKTKQSDVFDSDDVLISLRNINAVIVFDSATKKIKFIDIGRVLRQHDPDFVGDSRISIFDNNNRGLKYEESFSRIVEIDAQSGAFLETISGDNDKHKFYTNVMGKHQWLPDGHVLITEATAGRAFELDKDGNVVWEYRNIVNAQLVGVVQEVQRLPSGLWKSISEKVQPVCAQH
jgi:hypothetical protein